MKKSPKKRAPQGATIAMVLDALVRLHTKGGRRLAVSRAALLVELNLPETTVDDRLRTLMKQGRVKRVKRALYEPMSWPGVAPRRSEPPGTKKTTVMPDGAMVVEEWSKIPLPYRT